MADSAVDTILKAINDMQDKINSDFDEKLKKYVPMPLFLEAEAEAKGVARKVKYNEDTLKQLVETTEQNAERIEGNRKRIAKLAADLEALKGNKSSMNLAAEVASIGSMAESESQAALDGGDAGDNEKLRKMIQRVEGNLIRRIATLEGSLSKISNLEDEMVNVKLDLANGLKRIPNISREDIDKWHKNCDKTDELEEAIRQLQKDLRELDGPKIKADILNIFKVQQNFVVKEQLTPIAENARRIDQEVKDNREELRNMKERISTNEKQIERNQTEIKAECKACQTQADDNKVQIDELNKKLAMLDEKIKAQRSGAALGGGNGGGGVGAGVVEDLEAALAKLRDDLEKHRGDYARDQAKVKDELNQKATKQELEDLEARMMQRLQDMFDQLRGMFPDKEALKKKLAALEKNVSIRADLELALSHQF